VSRSSSTIEKCSPLGTFDELELLAAAFDRSNTQMQNSQKELVVAKEVAEDAVKSRSEFFAVMSHELRTPMNGVLGMTDVLQLTALSKEQLECVETIRGCGEILISIVNDVLDYTKIESGKLQLELLPTDIFRLSDRVLTLVRRSAENKGLELRLEGTGPVNQKWLVDSVRLRQILLNLLSNAIKFTDSGEVVLKIVITAQSQGYDMFEMRVCDTGIGIANSDIDKLFKSFTQTSLKTSRLYGGTGLGLAICHKLVNLMGGEIHVESQLGQGSCFIVRLGFSRFMANFPIIESARAASGVPASKVEFSTEFAQHFPLDILVVDDDPVNRKIVSKLLEKLGYQSHVAIDGQVAVDYVSRSEVDIIFMDLQMPRLNGLEATMQIRNMLGVKRLYIIGMTAANLSSDGSTCLKKGMNDFVIKPIGMTRLTSLLREAYATLHP
jgi:CheY-like chemotaxis protein/nitrogen-specific signal transduction histidine kinase